jgi:hypothetical protein
MPPGVPRTDHPAVVICWFGGLLVSLGAPAWGLVRFLALVLLFLGSARGRPARSNNERPLGQLSRNTSVLEVLKGVRVCRRAAGRLGVLLGGLLGPLGGLLWAFWASSFAAGGT